MKAWMDDPRVEKFKRPVVAIVRFNQDRHPNKPLPQNPATHFQVTVNPANISRSGEFMRFGHHEGDEIHGWIRRDQLWIEELLGIRMDAKTVSVDELFIDFPELKQDALHARAA